MSLEITGVRGVTKNYGVRKTGGAEGQYRSINKEKTLSFLIDRQFIADAAAGQLKLNTFIPTNSTVLEAKLIVTEVFDDTTAITFSTDSQGTVPIAATELGTVAVVDITPTGNMASGALTDATESFTYTGVVDGGDETGEAELIITYIQAV
jgi:hypothetical protein